MKSFLALLTLAIATARAQDYSENRVPVWHYPRYPVEGEYYDPTDYSRVEIPTSTPLGVPIDTSLALHRNMLDPTFSAVGFNTGGRVGPSPAALAADAATPRGPSASGSFATMFSLGDGPRSTDDIVESHNAAPNSNLHSNINTNVNNGGNNGDTSNAVNGDLNGNGSVDGWSDNNGNWGGNVPPNMPPSGPNAWNDGWNGPRRGPADWAGPPREGPNWNPDNLDNWNPDNQDNWNPDNRDNWNPDNRDNWNANNRDNWNANNRDNWNVDNRDNMGSGAPLNAFNTPPNGPFNGPHGRRGPADWAGPNNNFNGNWDGPVGSAGEWNGPVGGAGEWNGPVGGVDGGVNSNVVGGPVDNVNNFDSNFNNNNNGEWNNVNTASPMAYGRPVNTLAFAAPANYFDALAAARAHSVLSQHRTQHTFGYPNQRTQRVFNAPENVNSNVDSVVSANHNIVDDTYVEPVEIEPWFNPNFDMSNSYEGNDMNMDMNMGGPSGPSRPGPGARSGPGGPGLPGMGGPMGGPGAGMRTRDGLTISPETIDAMMELGRSEGSPLSPIVMNAVMG